MSSYYVSLPGGTVRPADLMAWARWYEGSADVPFDEGGRRVAWDELPGRVCVSTVFLGLDHSHGRGDPVLYETMIFGGEHDEYQDRYATTEEARAGHAAAVALARGG